MKNLRSIRQLQDQRTLRLFILSLLTFGVYIAYYIDRQTLRINQLVHKEQHISQVLVRLIFVSLYGSLIALLALLGSVLVDKGHPIEYLLCFFLLSSGIMVIVCTVKAGNRLNAHYQIASSDIIAFDRFWIVAFHVLYFNYNINSICKYGIE